MMYEDLSQESFDMNVKPESYTCGGCYAEYPYEISGTEAKDIGKVKYHKENECPVKMIMGKTKNEREEYLKVNSHKSIVQHCANIGVCVTRAVLAINAVMNFIPNYLKCCNDGMVEIGGAYICKKLVDEYTDGEELHMIVPFRRIEMYIRDYPKLLMSYPIDVEQSSAFLPVCGMCNIPCRAVHHSTGVLAGKGAIWCVGMQSNKMKGLWYTQEPCKGSLVVTMNLYYLILNSTMFCCRNVMRPIGSLVKGINEAKLMKKVQEQELCLTPIMEQKNNENSKMEIGNNEDENKKRVHSNEKVEEEDVDIGMGSKKYKIDVESAGIENKLMQVSHVENVERNVLNIVGSLMGEDVDGEEGIYEGSDEEYDE